VLLERVRGKIAGEIDGSLACGFNADAAEGIADRSGGRSCISVSCEIGVVLSDRPDVMPFSRYEDSDCARGHSPWTALRSARHFSR
jgi:hypothetical protein